MEDTCIHLEKIIHNTSDINKKALAHLKLAFILDRLEKYPLAFKQLKLARLCISSNGPLTNEAFDFHGLQEKDHGELYLKKTSNIPIDRRPSPTFLMGFFDSGSELLQELLNLHPRITAGSNTQALAYIKALLNEISPGDKKPAQKIALLSNGQAKKLRAEYWKYITSRCSADGTSSLFVDVYPYDAQDLQIISILFPEARVILTLRDPRDVCLSSYLQSFPTCHSAEEPPTWESLVWQQASMIHHYYSLRKHLACRILDVLYEEMVTHPETQLRGVLRFLGETWSYRIPLDDHFTGSEHAKDSIKIRDIPGQYQATVGRWKNYLDFFDSVRKPLTPLIERSGYPHWINPSSEKIA